MISFGHIYMTTHNISRNTLNKTVVGSKGGAPPDAAHIWRLKSFLHFILQTNNWIYILILIDVTIVLLQDVFFLSAHL